MTPIVLTSGWNVVRELIHQFEDAAATDPKDDAALIKQIQNHQALVAAIKGARNVELAIGQPLAGSEVDRLLAALYNVATTPLPPESDFTANPAPSNALSASVPTSWSRSPSAAVNAAVTGGQFQADTIDRYKQQERYYASEPPVMQDAPDRSASVPPKSPAPEPPAADTPPPPLPSETAGPLDVPAPSGDPSGNPGAGPSAPEPVSSPSASASAGAAPESAPPAVAPESSRACESRDAGVRLPRPR